MPRESISITLDAELLERIDRLADEDDRNRSNMIERLIREALDARQPAPQVDEVPA